MHNGKRNKGRWMLLLLVLVCSAPVVLSWVLVKYSDNISFNDASHGELITPAVPLPATTLSSYTDTSRQAELRGKWFLLYWAGESCEDDCHRKLGYMERIRQATGRESHRLWPLLFAKYDGVPRDLNYDGVHRLWLWHIESGDDALLNLARSDSRIGSPGDYYLIDPLGNILIRYAPESDPVGIIKDIKRLMRASRTG